MKNLLLFDLPVDKENDAIGYSRYTDSILEAIESDAKIIGLYDLNNQQIVDNLTTLNIISIAIDEDMVTYLNKALAIGKIKLIIGDDLYENKKVKINLSDTILNYLS